MFWLRLALFTPKEKKFALLIAALFILCVASIILSIVMQPLVVNSLVVEAGQYLPPVSEFITASGKVGHYLSGMPEDTSIPGDYRIVIEIGKKRYSSTLTVQDTIAPTAHAATVSVWAGAIVQPSAFVCDVHDATKITYSFVNKPKTSQIGIKSATVALTDKGGNTTLILSEVHVYDTISMLDIQPNADISQITALSFIKNASDHEAQLFTLDTDLNSFDLSIPGKHNITVSMGDEKQGSLLNILDITPPTASPLHIYKFIGDTLTPTEFVADIYDESPVTASFALAPDNKLEGEQPVMILLTDSYNNTALINSTLTLKPDNEPPIISGMVNKTIFVGDTIAYRAGITVTDNRDTEVLLKIDSSAVDAKTAGQYPVVYSATDMCGNTATAQGTLTVLEVSREQVYEMADAVLANIVTDNMSLYNKANAIYQWVKSNIGYINTSIKDDPTLAAYRAFKDRRGDCFIFASVATLLLTRAGIDNVLVQRIPGTRNAHYWSLVNIGEGWYHFDTTPHNNGGNCFMLTETQLQALGRKRGQNYYAYDKSLYPEAVQ